MKPQKIVIKLDADEALEDLKEFKDELGRLDPVKAFSLGFKRGGIFYGVIGFLLGFVICFVTIFLIAINYA